MDNHEMTLKSYLEELYRQSGGDLESQTSMYDIGAAMGLEKAEAGNIAEQLMVEGLAELKTLAGGIAITAEGLAHLGISAAPLPTGETGLKLSNEVVAGDNDRGTVQKIIEQLKSDLPDLDLSYQQLEEIVMDLKTIEVYMLSPRPKLSVLKEIFRSLAETFESVGSHQTANDLQATIR